MTDKHFLFITSTEKAAGIIESVAKGKVSAMAFDRDAVLNEMKTGRKFAVVVAMNEGDLDKATEASYMADASRRPVISVGQEMRCETFSSIEDAVKEVGIIEYYDIVNTAIAMAQQLADDQGYILEDADFSGTTGIDRFFEEIRGEQYKPLKTGISDIDRMLDGGFLRKTLVTLSAAPGAGKTLLAQWIFEEMAAAGQNVLFLNLEMDRTQLLARSISRLSWKYSKVRMTPLEVLRGYNWTPAQADAIRSAAETYKSRIAPRLSYNPEMMKQSGQPGSAPNHIDRIIAVMNDRAAAARENNQQAPVVVIDYLQIVATDERDPGEAAKVCVSKLKNWAIENDTVVFLICAQNRNANKSGASDMESGRDTSAIEYSADQMLGIVYTAIEDGRQRNEILHDDDGEPIRDKKTGDLRRVIKPYDIDTIRRLRREAAENGTAPEAVCNEISLKVIKNRFGVPERRVNLIFDGEHSSFQLIEKKQAEPDRWQQVTVDDGLPFSRQH